LIKFFYGNFRKILIGGMLPWPFGHSTFRLGGLAKYLFLNCNSDGKSFLNAVDRVTKLSTKIVEEKMNDPELKNQKDLLAMFMNSEDKDGNTYAQPQYTAFLRSSLLHFIIAGRDTTACVLSWMFYILSTNPDIQQKLCDEIDQVLQGQDPSLDDVSPNRLPYLHGLVYETLRLYPPIPFVSHKCFLFIKI
jgi:cytochrome P450